MSLFEMAYASPVGRLSLVSSETELHAVLWQNDAPSRVPLPARHVVEQHALLETVREQLDAYFAGKLKEFDLPLNPQGTPFQQAVWHALRHIPYGETRSYSQLAESLNAPAAVRAVGSANGRNPISIIIRCHRVLGKDGTLTGFAGGLAVKAQLLALEQYPRRLL